MNEKELFNDIRQYCIANANEEIVKKYAKYFKEGFDSYGLSTDLYTNKEEQLFQNPKINLPLMLKTAPLLLKTGKYEETSFAIMLTNKYSDQFTIETFKEVEKWFKIGITNWAHTDVLCGKIMKAFFNKKIIALNNLADWRNAENEYQRRAVPVSMLELLKAKKDFAKRLKFIEPLMMDSEEKVQQGLGWFLREMWKIDRKLVEEFLIKWKDKSPRVIFQYATEKMTKEEKEKFRKEKVKK